MPNRVAVSGLRELRTALKAVDARLPGELRDELKELARRVAVRTAAKIPKRTGETARSVRPVAAGAGAAVRAGGARAVWYGWLDFGGTIRHQGSKHGHATGHFITREVVRGGRYLYPSADEEVLTIRPEVERLLDRLFRDAGFV